MKRLALALTMVLALAATAPAQTPIDFDTLETAFGTFATEVANSLPANATIGLMWSDAYIGQLIDMPPHFGVGLTVGLSTIPFAPFEAVFTQLGLSGSIPQELLQFRDTLGIPIPGYAVDARVGGFGLPFDIGLKAGVLTDDMVASIAPGATFTVEYQLFGGDVRFALIEETAILPDLSIAAGYNFLRGSVGVPGLLGGRIPIGSFDVPTTGGGTQTYDIALDDPSVTFRWGANVIDLRAQVSKRILIFTPYAGFGASVGISTAGGGLSSSLLYNDGSGYQQMTQSLADQIIAAFEAAGQTAPDLNVNQGLLVDAQATGWQFRAFGGFSLDIFFIRLDIGAMYNVVSGSLGANVGLRFQL